jgi:acyl dehydratase
MFSTLLGTKLPGGGTNYLKQSIRFLRLASVNDEFTAAVEIVRLRPEKELVNLRTVCINQAGETVCEGEALVLVRDIQTEPSVVKG